MTDVDFFKKYNDAYGHPAGDECLRRVAEALAKAVRRPADLPARYGGEEFALILPSTPREGASRVAESVRSGVEALALPHAGSDVARYVTLSLGIATLEPGESVSVKDFIERADTALYAAKRGGRNRWAIYCPPEEGRAE
jgi:diguanylate cyclase (GGDEF)-like protein